MMRFMSSVVNDKEKSWRKDVLNDKINGLTIDTCYCPDIDKWETGIEKDKWIIVEEYLDKDEAIKGHKKWVAKIKKNPKMKLKECRSAEDWFFGDG